MAFPFCVTHHHYIRHASFYYTDVCLIYFLIHTLQYLCLRVIEEIKKSSKNNFIVTIQILTKENNNNNANDTIIQLVDLAGVKSNYATDDTSKTSRNNNSRRQSPPDDTIIKNIL